VLTSKIGPVLLVSGIDALGFSIVLPFLVFVVHDFGGNAVVYGALAATYPAFQLLASPVLGRWSDTKGRRPVMLISEAGMVVGWALFAVAMILPMTHVTTASSGIPLAVLFLARAVEGLTGGNVSVANAYVADVTPTNERSAAFGTMGVAASLGFVIGPAIAGLIGKSYLIAVLGALALSMTATLVVARRLPESLPCVQRKLENRAQAAVVFGIEPRPCVNLDVGRERFRDTLRVAYVPRLLLFYFVAYMGFTVFQAAFPAHAATTLHWTVRQTGVLFTVLSATLAIVQGLVTGRLSKKLGNRVVIASGSAVLGIGLLLFASIRTPLVYAAGVLYATGTGLMWPPLLAVIANAAGGKHQGAVQGLAGSAGGVASMLGLLLGGILYESVGSATFLVASAMLMVCAVMSLALAQVTDSSRTF
jgi:MFS transporter, DHA1 family, tetracycline resistance protein